MKHRPLGMVILVTRAGGMGYLKKGGSTMFRKKKWMIEECVLRWQLPSSYLALDVYFAEGRSPKAIEESGGLSDFHSIGLIVDDALRTVGLEKFTTDVIVVEAKLISEESQCNVSIPV